MARDGVLGQDEMEVDQDPMGQFCRNNEECVDSSEDGLSAQCDDEDG